LQDMVDRCSLHKDELTRLAEVGALNAFGLTRRSALWQVERAARPRGPLFDGGEEAEASPLPAMGMAERLHADMEGTGVTVGRHPLHLHRAALAERGVRRAGELPALPAGRRVR